MLAGHVSAAAHPNSQLNLHASCRERWPTAVEALHTHTYTLSLTFTLFANSPPVCVVRRHTRRTAQKKMPSLNLRNDCDATSSFLAACPLPPHHPPPPHPPTTLPASVVAPHHTCAPTQSSGDARRHITPPMRQATRLLAVASRVVVCPPLPRQPLQLQPQRACFSHPSSGAGGSVPPARRRRRYRESEKLSRVLEKEAKLLRWDDYTLELTLNQLSRATTRGFNVIAGRDTSLVCGTSL